MAEVQLPQEDTFPQVTKGTFPKDVRKILSSQGKDVSALEKSFNEAIAQGGEAKRQAVEQFYRGFDQVLGTKMYSNMLESYNQQYEAKTATPDRNQQTNIGLAAPNPNRGIIGGEALANPAQKEPAATPELPQPEQPQTQPGQPSPVQETTRLQPAANQPADEELPAKVNNADPDMPWYESGLKIGWNAIMNKAKGVSQTILAAKYLQSDIDDIDPEDYGIPESQRKILNEKSEKFQEILPTDGRVTKKLKLQINARLEEEKKFKKAARASDRWFEDNLMFDVPDEKAPVYYDVEKNELNTDNITNFRAWTNTITGSAAGTLVDLGVAAAAARASRGRSASQVKLLKNAARGVTFVSSTAQMFPGYLQEGLDNGLSYGDALKVAGPLSVVNGAIELAGLEYMMKGFGMGKTEAVRVVRDVLNTSAKDAIRQLARKEITQEAFLEVIKSSVKLGFKNLASKDGIKAAAKIVGATAKTGFKAGFLPEAGEELFQGTIEQGAKDLFNKYGASQGSKGGQGRFPGDGTFDAHRKAALTNTLLGTFVGGIVGQGMSAFYSSPKVFDQSMFNYANVDIKDQLNEGSAADINAIKGNGKIFKKIDQWAAEGQFDVVNNGRKEFDQETYDQVKANANLMYDTAWDFKDFDDFDDLTRYDMYNVAKNRQDLRNEGVKIKGIRDQITQIDQWLADPESIPENEYGGKPSEIMLENQRAAIEKTLGPLNEETGQYQAEEKYQAVSTEMENLFKQAVPGIHNVDTRRVGRSFLKSGLDAINSQEDPVGDSFRADKEITLADGSVFVTSAETPHEDFRIRRLTTELVPEVSVLDQIDRSSYKPVNRYKYKTAAVNNFKQYLDAVNTEPKGMSRDTTREFNVADDAGEVLTTGRDFMASLATLPPDVEANYDTVTKLFGLYNRISEHPDAVDDGVAKMTPEEFFTAIGAESLIPTAEESAPADVAAPGTESAPAAAAASSSIGSLLDAPVMFNGQRSNLRLDGQTVVAEPIGSDQIFEVGNIDEIRDRPSSEFNIQPETTVANINADGTITVRDRRYENKFTNPLSAINRNKSGDIVSVTLSEKTPTGKYVTRNFKGQPAQDIAYEIIQQENSKENGTEDQFNQFAEGNEFVQQEIVASETTDAAEGQTEQDNDALPGSPEPAAAEGGTTGNSTVNSNETTNQPADTINPAPTSAIESEYTAAGELSGVIGNIEQQQGSLRSTVGSANKSAESLTGTETETVDPGISGLIAGIRNVVNEAGRVNDQIEASVAQIRDEAFAEPSDDVDSQEGATETEQSDDVADVPLKVENTPISKINTDTDRFQNREAEFSESSVQSIVNAVKNNSFDFTKFDPVRLWVDPKNGKTYVLAGHSRTEAFNRLTKSGNTRFKNIPSIYMNHLTEAQAIQFALDESNTMASQESDIEGAAAWRRKREAGERDSQIRVSIGNRANKARIELLSYLRPDGPVMDMMRSLSDASASNATRVNQVAEFIGNAYKTFGDQLSSSHENEMFEYLTEGAGKKITKRSEFMDRVNNLVNNIGFNKEMPLNLANRTSKGSAQVEAENIMNDLLEEKKVLEKERSEAKSEENINNLDAQMRNLNKKIVDARRAIDAAKVGDRSQTSLFSFAQPNTPQINNPIYPVLNRIAKSFPGVTLNVPASHQDYVDALNANPRNRTVFQPGESVPYGYVNPIDGSVNLDPSRLNANTAMHEYGHVWVKMVEQSRPDLYNKGIDLIRQGSYIEGVKKDSRYANLSAKEILDEALAAAIGDKGESFVLESRKKTFTNWLNQLFNDVKKFFGLRNLSPQQVQDLDLESFTNGVIADLLSGDPISQINPFLSNQIMEEAGIQMQADGKEMTDEEVQANMDNNGGEIKFSFRPPVPYGSRSGEIVGSRSDFLARGRALMPSLILRKAEGDFDASDKKIIENVRQKTGWEFKGRNSRTGIENWNNDISRWTNPELLVNEMYHTDDDRIIYVETKSPASGSRGVIAQKVYDGIKEMMDAGPVSSAMMEFGMKHLRIMNIESVVSMIDSADGLITQLVKNVKRQGANRRNLARTQMMEPFLAYSKAMAPFSTFNGSTLANVRKIEVEAVVEMAGQMVKKKFWMPVGTAMSLARTEESQRSMSEQYLTEKDEFGVEDTHSSLVMADRHFDAAGNIIDPTKTRLLYGKEGVNRGATFAYSEIEEMDGTGSLQKVKDEFGKEVESISLVFTNSEMSRLINRFKNGAGAQSGEVEAYGLGTVFYNNKQVQDMLEEENNKFLNPSSPFQRISSYSPLSAVSKQRADSKVNSFNPNLEDSKRLHEREHRPSGLYIQDDVRTGKYYLEAVGNVLGYGRLLHNIKNIRDAIDRENSKVPYNDKIKAYLEAYVSEIQNFEQIKATDLSKSAFVRFVNMIYNKNTKFIFAGNIGISLKQISTFASALGQGSIKSKYLLQSLGDMTGYSIGAFWDSILHGGTTVNTQTGEGMRNVAGYGMRTVEADMVEYITGANITDPAEKLAHQVKFATIIDRALYGNNRYLAGVDYTNADNLKRSLTNGGLAAGYVQQGLNLMGNYFEEFWMAPMRRTDRAVIFAFVKAAQRQAKAEGYSGRAFDNRVAEMVEDTLYKTNQMNDLADTTALQRTADGFTKMLTVYTGQTQKLFNNLFQAYTEYHKYAHKSTTPEAVKRKLANRINGAYISNLMLVPLWNAVSEIGWAVIKSALKGEEPKEKEEYLIDGAFALARSLTSIVPGWTEQLSSVILSLVDNQKWTQSFFEIPGIDNPENGLASLLDWVQKYTGIKDGNTEKALDKLTYDVTRFGFMLTGIPKIIHDVLFAKEDQPRQRKISQKPTDDLDIFEDSSGSDEMLVPL